MLLPVCIIDDLLGSEAAQALLDFATANRDCFKPSLVFSKGRFDVRHDDFRSSLSYDYDLEDMAQPIEAAIARNSDRIRRETGSELFDPVASELEMVAHGDGHRFGLHIDTRTGGNLALDKTDRVISLVYYFHRRPQAFSGGNLVIHALHGEERHVVAPRHDRLVAFSSIAPHEVEPISLPGGDFADARFSVVCWLLRRAPERG
jgi:SM-20-related protein